MERERRVILREMEEVESQIEEVVFDRLHEVAYVGTPLARTILGPVENINSIMADDIVKYVKTHYTAPRMVLAAAGAVDHDELATLAGDYFGGVPQVAPEGLTYEALPSLFTGADVREYNDDMPLAHFALAFEGASPLATSHHPEPSPTLQEHIAVRMWPSRPHRYSRGRLELDAPRCLPADALPVPPRHRRQEEHLGPVHLLAAGQVPGQGRARREHAALLCAPAL